MKILALFLLIITCSCFAQEADNEKVLDFIQSQRFGEAAEYLKTVYPGEIKDDKVIARLAYLYYMNGNLPEAENNYLLLLQKDTLNKRVLLSLAEINNRRGNYTVSSDYYKRILRIDSTIFNVYKQLADIAPLTRDTNVIYYLQKANAINPSDGDVAYDLSDLYIQTKKFREAAMVLNTAIQADTSNLMLYRSKVKLSYALHEYKDVVTLCEKLVQAGDQSAIVLRYLGDAYFYTRNYQKSIDTFLKVEALDTSTPLPESVLYMIATGYQYINKDKEALEYFNRAISVGTKISDYIGLYYYAAGNSFTTLKQTNEALKAYKNCLKYQEIPLVYYRMAILYDQALRNKSNALKYYKKYVEVTARKPLPDEYISYAKTRINELTNIPNPYK